MDTKDKAHKLISDLLDMLEELSPEEYAHSDTVGEANSFLAELEGNE